MSRILVTGGAGFIGSALCRHLVKDKGYEVCNIDKLTYELRNRFHVLKMTVNINFQSIHVMVNLLKRSLILLSQI